MPTTAPYGSWRSPITADLIVSASIALGQPCFAGPDLYWLESRPTEGGRYVIVRRRPDGTTQDVNAAPLNARTRVHEYGGGDYVVAEDGTVYFSNFADQRLYVARPGAEPLALTHTDGMRYADAVIDPARNRLICVREDHTESAGGGEGLGGRSSSNIPREATNTIAAVDLTTGDETVLVEGSDFYAYPRLSPDGATLCWIAWDHPNMPWDETTVSIARIDPSGALAAPAYVDGGNGVSIFQPEWSPDGRLYYVSDRTGWWNLYRVALTDGQTGKRAEGSESARPEALEGPTSMPRPSGRGSAPIPLVPLDAEFGQPLWHFGAATYAFDGPSRIVCTYCVAGSWRLATIDTTTGALSDIDTPYTLIRELTACDGRALFFAGSPDAPSGLVSLDIATGAHAILKRTSTIEIDPATISRPQTIEFPTTPVIPSPSRERVRVKGASVQQEDAPSSETPTTAFGFYYPPRNRDFLPLASDPLPPLLVMSHGGPTSATAPVLSARIQYWTSRGIAVLDVNYGGSTGYGRAYRERLNRRWGIVDVEDCVNGARYLVDRGLADPNRLAITGGSAGGYTTLAALAFHDVFKAGASHYGVSDLAALATDTHKFESRYLDGLVGPYHPPDSPQNPLSPPGERVRERGRASEAEGSPDTAHPEAPSAESAHPEALEGRASTIAHPEAPSAESAHPEALEGPHAPDPTDPYFARSPIYHVDGLNCPVIFFQGLEDRIVPPNQAETMVAALRAKGVPCAYLPFEGEQHGFRRAENIKRSLEAELYFYGRIFNFTPADEIAPVEISGL